VSADLLPCWCVQEGHAGGGGLVPQHGLGCYPLGVRVASSPRPVIASRPTSGRSVRFPSPGAVSDLWRSESAASLASLQSAAFDSFPGTPVWSPLGPPPQMPLGTAGHAPLSNRDCAALAQLLDETALREACAGLPALGPSTPALFGRDLRLPTGFASSYTTMGASFGGNSQQQAGSGQQDFSGLRALPSSHEALSRHDAGPHGCGEPALFGSHGSAQGSLGPSHGAWSMQTAALANAWPLSLAA